ncbi:DUF4428 domain-containing protein [Secundilactobacillus silagei]
MCGKRLGFLDSNLRFNDGIACADCCKKNWPFNSQHGINKLGRETFC